MKKMTCKQLGGACDHEFLASTFEEISLQSRNHGIQMMQKGDQGHMMAMQQMQALMHKPGGLDNWMFEKRKEFEELPELKETG